MEVYVMKGGDLIAAAKSQNLIKVFAHGANCWSSMDAGFALKVKENFPLVTHADAEDPRTPDERLGGSSYAFDQGVLGFNLYTQYNPGPNASMIHLINAVTSMLGRVYDLLETEPSKKVAIGFPAIGSGIGGLRLRDVIPMIHNIFWTFRDDTGCQVVPVFYILNEQFFEGDLDHLGTLLGVRFITSEEEVKVLENMVDEEDDEPEAPQPEEPEEENNV